MREHAWFRAGNPGGAAAQVTKRPPHRLNFAFLANRVRGHGGATLAAYLLLFPRERW